MHPDPSSLLPPASSLLSSCCASNECRPQPRTLGPGRRSSRRGVSRGRRRPHQDKDCSVLWHDAEQDAHSSLRTSPASRGNLQARARVSLNLSATFEGAPPALAAGGARRVWRVGHRPWRQSRSRAAGPPQAQLGGGNRHHTELSRSLAHTLTHGQTLDFTHYGARRARLPAATDSAAQQQPRDYCYWIEFNQSSPLRRHFSVNRSCHLLSSSAGTQSKEAANW